MGEMGSPHMGKKGCWGFFCFLSSRFQPQRAKARALWSSSGASAAERRDAVLLLVGTRLGFQSAAPESKSFTSLGGNSFLAMQVPLNPPPSPPHPPPSYSP